MNTKKDIMSKIKFIPILVKDQHQDNKEIIFYLAERTIID